MKNIIKSTVEIKSFFGLVYMAEICLAIIWSYINGITAISLVNLLQMMLVAIIIVLFQFVFYGTELLGKISVNARLAIHFIAMGALLFALILWFKWAEFFSRSSAILAICYVVCFVAVSVCFSLYYKITGEKYNEKLKIFRQN